MNAPRAERVADEIREILAELIRRDVRDPRIGFVTVTSVALSPDLRHARVFVSAPVDGPARDEAIAALNHARPFLKRGLASRAKLRHTPDLVFEEDRSIARGARIERLIDEIRRDRDLEEAGPDGDPEPR